MFRSCLPLQLLDLPGIIEGAKDGKGRGRQVIAGRIFSHELFVEKMDAKHVPFHLETKSRLFATSACRCCLFLAVARTCNLILIVLDVLKPLGHKKLIEHELEGFGIRLNKQPPNIGFKKKDKGGINFTATVSLQHYGFLVRGLRCQNKVIIFLFIICYLYMYKHLNIRIFKYLLC